MAEKIDELQDMAFRLFAERTSRANAKRGAEQLAKQCFTDAADFLAVAKSVATGGVKAAKPAGPQLAEWCCPNMGRELGIRPEDHPLNIVSKRYGSLEKVRKYYDRIKSDHVTELPELNWGPDQVSLAREIFPAYLN